MKNIIIIILVILIIFIFYKISNNESYQNTLLFRKYIKPAKCIENDTESTYSKFQCTLNPSYSPLNINVTIVKYQNVVTVNSLSSPSTLAPVNLFSTLMTVLHYNDPNMKLLDPLPQGTKQTASLDNNNFLYLPDSIVTYINSLYDLNLLQPFINSNNINTINAIANQFSLYLQGYLVNYDKPDSDYQLQREIAIIYTPDLKNIISINFNQTVTYTINNQQMVTTKTTNINTQYTYLFINSYINYMNQHTDNSGFINSILNTVNTYSVELMKRNLINDYQLNEFTKKINNIDNENLQYILIYHNEGTFGFILVKRIDGNLVFLNYLDSSFNYYKNICDDITQYNFKGRCYAACPTDYINTGLTCVLKNQDSLFNPDSDYCRQVCNTSNDDTSVYDPIIQKACWCKSVKCDDCINNNIENCNC